MVEWGDNIGEHWKFGYIQRTGKSTRHFFKELGDSYTVPNICALTSDSKLARACRNFRRIRGLKLEVKGEKFNTPINFGRGTNEICRHDQANYNFTTPPGLL